MDAVKSPIEYSAREEPNGNEVPVPRLDSPENDRLLISPDEPKDDFDVDVAPWSIEDVPVDVEICTPENR